MFFMFVVMKDKKIVKTAETGLLPLVIKKPIFQMRMDGRFDVYLLRTYYCTIDADKIGEFQIAHALIQNLHGV